MSEMNYTDKQGTSIPVFARWADMTFITMPALMDAIAPGWCECHSPEAMDEAYVKATEWLVVEGAHYYCAPKECFSLPTAYSAARQKGRTVCIVEDLS